MADINFEKSAAAQLEDTLGHGAIVEAKHASDEEHSQTIFQALRANRKAVIWSMLISMSIVMEGYDTILMGNFFGYPQFQRKYGKDYGGKIGWQVTAPWQSGLNMASTVGTVFGMFANFLDIYADVSGRRRYAEWLSHFPVWLSMDHDRSFVPYECVHIYRLLCE